MHAHAQMFEGKTGEKLGSYVHFRLSRILRHTARMENIYGIFTLCELVLLIYTFVLNAQRHTWTLTYFYCQIFPYSS